MTINSVTEIEYSKLINYYGCFSFKFNHIFILINNR